MRRLSRLGRAAQTEGTGTHGSWAAGRDGAVAGTGRLEPCRGREDPRGAKRTPKNTCLRGPRGRPAPLTAAASSPVRPWRLGLGAPRPGRPVLRAQTPRPPAGHAHLAGPSSGREATKMTFPKRRSEKSAIDLKKTLRQLPGPEAGRSKPSAGKSGPRGPEPFLSRLTSSTQHASPRPPPGLPPKRGALSRPVPPLVLFLEPARPLPHPFP